MYRKGLIKYPLIVDLLYKHPYLFQEMILIHLKEKPVYERNLGFERWFLLAHIYNLVIHYMIQSQKTEVLAKV